MAIEAERLLAVFEARFSSLEKALTKARSDATKSFGAIEDAGARAEKTLAGIGARGVPGLTRMTGAMRGTRLETANVAAQMNDIAVQLASGQSPFLIAVQQGTQLNQVLGQGGVRGAVGLLGGAFASLINPVSLATIAIIGLGGYAIQYFATILTEGDKSAEAIQKQIDLIRQVADRWGDAVPALQAYVAELDRAKESADALAAGQTVRENLFAPLQEAAGALNVEMVDFVSQLQQAGVGQDVIDELQDAFVNLREEVEANTADSRDTDRAQAALNATMAFGIGDASALSDALGTLSSILADVAEKASAADREIAGVINRSSTGGPARYQPGMIDLPGSVDVTPDRRIDPYFDAPASGRSRAPRISEAEREAEAVRKLISDLEFERSLIGMTAVEREQANAVRRAGAAATEEQRAKIEGLVGATYAEREAVRMQEEAFRNLQQVGETALNGIATAMADGKIEGEELLSVLVNVARQFLTMPKGGGGGLLSMLFGGDGFTPNTTAGKFFSSFATGTNYAPGGMALVGEKGPEIVNLPRGSQVIPNHKIGGGASITYSPVIDMRGASVEAVARLETVLARDKAEFGARVIKTVREAHKGRHL